MKLYHILILGLLMLALSAQAQVPQAISFQGMAMDGNGGLITNQSIEVVVDIHKNSPSGQTVYSEVHEVTTSDLGHFTLEIGRGSNSSTSFSKISWGEADHFAEIDLDGQLVGIVQLVSVPYAFVAQEAGNGIAGLTGATGAQGPQGATGATGPTGPPGPDGNGTDCWDINGNGIGDPFEDVNGDGVYSTDDCTGPAGPTGAQGPQGAQGPEGPKGSDIGAKGPDGPRGPRGDAYVGPPGNPGPDGAKGLSGPQGPQGAAGAAGAVGPEGDPGPQGPPGIGGGQPGPQGDKGPDGIAEGDPGDAGIACWDTNGNTIADAGEDKNGDGIVDAYDCHGVQGPAGASGATGAQGPQGPQGPFGPAGSNDKLNLPMLSTPPTSSGAGYYLDDGSNTDNGLPGFRYFDSTTNSWVG